MSVIQYTDNFLSTIQNSLENQCFPCFSTPYQCSNQQYDTLKKNYQQRRQIVNNYNSKTSLRNHKSPKYSLINCLEPSKNPSFENNTDQIKFGYYKRWKSSDRLSSYQSGEKKNNSPQTKNDLPKFSWRN